MVAALDFRKKEIDTHEFYVPHWLDETTSTETCHIKQESVRFANSYLSRPFG